MAFKPNYNFQKAERSRAKAQKKQEKLRRREEETARRKGLQDGAPEGDAGDPESTVEDA